MKQLEAISKEIKEILIALFAFKPLRQSMDGSRRVHIGSFVLIYQVIKKPSTVKILKHYASRVYKLS